MKERGVPQSLVSVCVPDNDCLEMGIVSGEYSAASFITTFSVGVPFVVFADLPYFFFALTSIVSLQEDTTHFSVRHLWTNVGTFILNLPTSLFRGDVEGS